MHVYCMHNCIPSLCMRACFLRPSLHQKNSHVYTCMYEYGRVYMHACMYVCLPLAHFCPVVAIQEAAPHVCVYVCMYVCMENSMLGVTLCMYV